MSRRLNISFTSIDLPKSGAVAFLVSESGKLSPAARRFDADGRLERAKSVAEFKGKLGFSVDVVAPRDGMDRAILVGTGGKDVRESDWMRVGGAALAAAGNTSALAIVAEVEGAEIGKAQACAIALGAKLRAYEFDAYKTKDRKVRPALKLAIACADPSGARKAWKDMEAAADGALLARDLVNEPPNALGPVEFANHARKLGELGVQVEVLDDKALRKLKMGALLGVAQGSARPARMVVMQWKGGKAGKAPVAFVGKGVVFDTGGISIKPAAGMEDMKGDMGGAAAVTGLMHSLAARKAKVNAVGIIGLVENMPDGNAQRPGDIVTSMSGQTIEIINTDAEGRLVLADALWYCQDRFKPQAMIDLATLTGAIMISLGQHYAGMFSNDDELARRLTDAGQATGERVWRMPMGPEYNKMMDSKFADVKNAGERWGGAITAAQFLERFVNKTVWAHLDIAGTAMGSPKNEYSQSWGSGFGVRLLDRLVADNYE
jgi:leucyl aminopeptidase